MEQVCPVFTSLYHDSHATCTPFPCGVQTPPAGTMLSCSSVPGVLRLERASPAHVGPVKCWLLGPPWECLALWVWGGSREFAFLTGWRPLLCPLGHAHVQGCSIITGQPHRMEPIAPWLLFWVAVLAVAAGWSLGWERVIDYLQMIITLTFQLLIPLHSEYC